MIGIFVLLFIAMLLVVKFCKKTLKIILAVVISIITLYCVIIFVDMNRTYTMKKPIFAISSGLKDYKDYSQEIYKGLGYRIELNSIENHEIISSTMYFFDKVIAGAISDYSENTQTTNNENKYSFIGKVIESNSNTIIVEPNEDEEIRKSSDKIAIGLGNTDALYMVGTSVKITYDGVIMETYPAQINVTKIDLKLAENFEIFFNEKKPTDSYKIYTILEKNKADNYNYTIYGYDGIVNIKIDDKDYSLKDALLQNKITMSEIIAKANQDEKDGKVKAEMYKDGGSKEYHYENYSIIKCHTIDGNRDVYIGTKDLKLSDVI